jgi:esterase/lipase superfamily enzyme
MNVARWGFAGKPFVLFPTGGADFLDVERFLLVRALQPLVEAGRIRLYSVDSVCRLSWVAEVDPDEKVAWQVRYARWLEGEFLPFVDADCGGASPPVGVGGASLGAYQAWSFAARRPDRVDLCVGLSGTYLMQRRLDGFWNEDWYFHDPQQFVPRMSGNNLAQLQGARFVFGIGENYENPTYTDAAAATMDDAGVRCDVLKWKAPAGHDWPTWRSMLPRILDAVV